MSDLSFRFSRALANGREGKGAPKSREQVLVALLRKRAEAHRQGLSEEESKLRNQIAWSLPTRSPEEG